MSRACAPLLSATHRAPGSVLHRRGPGVMRDANWRGPRIVLAASRGGPRVALDAGSRGLRFVLLGLIRVYQTLISGGLPPACRFEPTCSRYAYAAIERYGALRGGWLALRRLVRCQPWGGSGYDPVP